jgi:hypothetical protein
MRPTPLTGRSGSGPAEPVEHVVKDADEGGEVGGRDATKQHPGASR